MTPILSSAEHQVLENATQVVAHLYQQQQWTQAEQVCTQILAVDATRHEALHLMALIFRATSRSAESIEFFERALHGNHHNAICAFNLANALHDLCRFEDAITRYAQVLALQADLAPAWIGRGNSLFALKRHQEAIDCHERALSLDASIAQAWNGRGNALRALGQLEEAAASYDSAVRIKPGIAELHNNRGMTLMELGRTDEAIACYRKALCLDASQHEVSCNLASALLSCQQADAALEVLEKQPVGDVSTHADSSCANSTRATLLRGNALLALRRNQSALTCFTLVLANAPDNIAALIGRSQTLARLDRYTEAISRLDTALAHRECIELRFCRGCLLMDTGAHSLAIPDFQRVLSADPSNGAARGFLMEARLHCCDWTEHNKQLALIASGARDGEHTTEPFAALVHVADPALQLRMARRYSAQHFPTHETPLWRGERYDHGRIRIAYLSADFETHATTSLMAGLIESHDRTRFHIIGISIGAASTDPMRKRLEAAFDQFIDASHLDDISTARLIHELQIDVMVDMKGYTRGARPRILAMRCAPVQVSYLGFPGTMGADYVDYLLRLRVLADFQVLLFEMSALSVLLRCSRIGHK